MRLRFKAEEAIDKKMAGLDVGLLVRMPGEYGKRFAMEVAEAALKTVGAKAVAAGERFGEEV
jgi:hypothetical protein